MDNFTLSTLGIVVPFAVFTLLFGLALGPIASRLAKWRQSL
ncbi:hypothetical protein [Komagataeibacter melaceti]|nr:hypothetical protein [Komagataeibacter melaceti]